MPLRIYLNSLADYRENALHKLPNSITWKNKKEKKILELEFLFTLNGYFKINIFIF